VLEKSVFYDGDTVNMVILLLRCWTEIKW